MCGRAFIRLAAFLCFLPSIAWAHLPRHSSEILLVGDSVAAGMYFLEIDPESVSQSWTGQVLRALGMDAPGAPFDHPYPIDHLRLARDGFGTFCIGYAWEARRALNPGKPHIDVNQERTVLAIPGQLVGDFLDQSTRTEALNKHSAGWTFARLTLPKDKSAIETVESWQKRPSWIVVFLGSNDLMASFGILGDARPTAPETFRAQYAALVDRLRARMPVDAPARQLIVATLPDVTVLPFLQELAASADNGHGDRYPAGSKATAFLIPHRSHFMPYEVWTPDQLEDVRHHARDYNAAILDIARERGLTVIDMEAVSARMAKDPAYSSASSPYFSPDLHHPSYRTHREIAKEVIRTLVKVAGEAPPDSLPLDDKPLPSAQELSGERERVNALMHLAMQGLKIGPLPRKFTARVSLEVGAQGGDERIGDGVVVAMAGIEGLPVPVSNHILMRICAHGRAAAVAYHSSGQDTQFFPARGLEGRVGLGFEEIGSWSWSRFELGGLITPDDAVDFGFYARQEWRMLYLEAASRGWLFDRIEAGVRFGTTWGRPGRNGN
jgi:lysophospholipase L1-like esterase